MTKEDGTPPESISHPERPLAGLVSPAAEELYEQITRFGRLRVGTGDGEIDLDSAAARELTEADLLYGYPADADWVQAVSVSTALPLLLSRQQQQITAAQERALQGWSKLQRLLRTDYAQQGGAQTVSNNASEIIHDRASIVSLSVDLYMGARQDLCATTRGRYTNPLAEHQIVVPPKTALNSGATYRNIYDGEFSASPAGARIIERSREAGEDVRIRAVVPTKMLLVDHRIAMVALNDTGIGGALIVRSPQLLGVLYEWFDFVWQDSAGAGDAVDHPLTPSQRHVLRLLATGMTDDAIARSSDMSVRTVRRHITAIIEALGITTRFAAGAAAAKRGWI